MLTGARHSVCLIGGSQDRAGELLSSIRRSILFPECDDLRADFPEALHPLWCLRNNARKQIGQHIDGEPTYCPWASDKLVFPVVTGDRLPAALRHGRGGVQRGIPERAGGEAGGGQQRLFGSTVRRIPAKTLAALTRYSATDASLRQRTCAPTRTSERGLARL